jgi:hypothetical protein
MFIKTKEGELKKLIMLAISKSGSIRKLSRQIQVPKTAIFEYSKEQRTITEENFNKITSYLKIIPSKEVIIKKYPISWRQKLGGRNAVKEKKKRGIFEEQLKKMRAKIDPKSKNYWHTRMKKENPERYYLMQYEKFKKIGEYKFKTARKERVRNKLERETANFLFNKGIEYEYEKLIKIGKRYFFPDFFIKDKNLIIECTEWRGIDKAIKLKHKISYLKKEHNVIILIPKNLKRYYETLKDYLVYDFNDLNTKIKSS